MKEPYNHTGLEYVQGVSTRKVKAFMEQHCGVEASRPQGSQETVQLNEVLQEWCGRPLGKISYLLADARYDKAYKAKQVRGAEFLVASGTTPKDERQISEVQFRSVSMQHTGKSF